MRILLRNTLLRRFLFARRISTSQLRPCTSAPREGKPIPFLKSKARAFKIDDAENIKLAPWEETISKYAIPIGLVLFSLLLYVMFFTEKDETEEPIPQSIEELKAFLERTLEKHLEKKQRVAEPPPEGRSTPPNGS